MDQFNSITEIIEDIKKGKIVIMLDDHDRENEGDFVMAAEAVTPASINFMATFGRGLICTPLSKNMAIKLGLPPMVESNTAAHETAFTVTIDALEGITTGISASDRAYTIKLMTNEKTTASDFSRPGHIFPLIAKDGGVLKRRGHTEAAVDLATLSGFKPLGVICEVLREDGEQARGQELFDLAKRFDLKIGTIQDLALYLENGEKIIEDTFTLVSEVNFPNKHGHFLLSCFKFQNEEHLAIHLGDFKSLKMDERVLVRLHSECLTGDVFGSKRCDCGEQLESALKKIAEAGRGVLIYLRQEGRGIGLSEKLKAYALQDLGRDTVEANIELGHPVDGRNYESAGFILNYFGISTLSLLTNNPDKLMSLKKYGFDVLRISHTGIPNLFNERYLDTKKEKMGHLYN